MIGFPLLLIPLAIYNIIVFLMPGVSFAAALVTVPLLSGASWTVTLSDAMLAFGLFLLLLEIIKGARPLGKYVTDHLLALLIFAGAAAEFVMLPQFASSTFLLLTMLALIDFISGVSLRARRPRRSREIVVSPPVTAEPDRAREPVVDVPVAIQPSPAPVLVPVAAEPARVEPVPTPPTLHANEEIVPRVEPITDRPTEVAEIERERHPDEINVPVRTTPAS